MYLQYINAAIFFGNGGPYIISEEGVAQFWGGNLRFKRRILSHEPLNLNSATA